MNFVQAQQQKYIFSLYCWADFQSISTFGLLRPHSRFSFSICDVCLSQKSSKYALLDGVGKNYGNFRASLVATLIRSIRQAHSVLFFSEQVCGELTNQSQSIQLNKDSDPTEGERQPPVILFKVPIKRRIKPLWGLPSGTKPHYGTGGRQKLEMHLLSIQKESKKWSALWCGAVKKENV